MKKFLPILLFVFFAGFVTLSILLPGRAKDLVKKKKQLNAILQTEKSLPALEKIFSENDEKIALLDSTFLSKKDLVSVVQSIDTLAAKTGVFAILHFESEEVLQNNPGSTVIPISITIDGNFTNTTAFISSLKSSKYLYDLESVDGKSPNGLEAENKVLVKGNLYVANE